jgi:hypothetical protein
MFTTPIILMQDLQTIIRDTAKLIREAHRQIPGPEFGAEYSRLVDRMFLGGYAETFEKIHAGDGSAVEFGLVFVEIRPYFFRSQYLRTRLIRMLKQARLGSLHAERLKRILDLEHDKKTKSKEAKWKILIHEAVHTQKRKGKTHAKLARAVPP